jgi:hypothetical protein
MHATDKNIQTVRAGRKDRPVWLMVTLFALLLVYPAFEGHSPARVVLNIFFTLILLSSALAMWREHRIALGGICLGVPAVVLGWIGTFVQLGTVVAVIGQGLFAGFIMYVAVLHVIKALGSPTVNNNTLCRAVSAYILIGVAWSGFYQILALLDPSALSQPVGQQNWGVCLYFSFTVLTTLGFGDITPVSAHARSLVTVESIVGPMYLAVLIARLVAMHRRPSAGE